jgi:hypothetical protein
LETELHDETTRKEKISRCPVPLKGSQLDECFLDVLLKTHAHDTSRLSRTKSPLPDRTAACPTLPFMLDTDRARARAYDLPHFGIGRS